MQPPVVLEGEIRSYVDTIIECIKTSSAREYSLLIDDWSYVNMTLEQEAIAVPEIVDAMSDYNAADMLGELVGKLDETGTGYSYVHEMFTYLMGKKALDFVMDVYEVEYYELVRGLMYLLDGKHKNLTLTAIANMRKVFSRPDDVYPDTLQKLIIICENVGNDELLTYLKETLSRARNPPAERPEWMLDSGRTHEELVKEALALVKEYVAEIGSWVSDSLEDDVEYIMHLSGDVDDSDALRRDITGKFAHMPLKERQELVSTIVWNTKMMYLADRADLFRVFGLCLPLSGGLLLKVLSKDPCEMWGGCRAMTCWHNENVDIHTDDVVSQDPVAEGRLDEIWWFTGKCDECMLVIEKECYAVRMPLETGGFEGCFCSFECMRKRVKSQPISIAVEDKYEGTKLTEGINENRLHLVNKMEQMYNKFGIWDRD